MADDSSVDDASVDIPPVDLDSIFLVFVASLFAFSSYFPHAKTDFVPIVHVGSGADNGGIPLTFS
jgi:hypothetical protein